MPVLRKFKSRRFLSVFICVHLWLWPIRICVHLWLVVICGYLWIRRTRHGFRRSPGGRQRDCNRVTGKAHRGSPEADAAKWRQGKELVLSGGWPGGQRSTAPIQRIERPLTKTCPAESAVIRVNP